MTEIYLIRTRDAQELKPILYGPFDDKKEAVKDLEEAGAYEVLKSIGTVHLTRYAEWDIQP